MMISQWSSLPCLFTSLGTCLCFACRLLYRGAGLIRFGHWMYIYIYTSQLMASKPGMTGDIPYISGVFHMSHEKMPPSHYTGWIVRIPHIWPGSIIPNQHYHNAPSATWRKPQGRATADEPTASENEQNSKLMFKWHSIYLSVCLSVYPSINLSISLSIYLSLYLSIYLPICLSVYLSINLSISLSLSLSLSLYRSTHLSISLSVYLSIYLSVYPSIYQSIYLSLSISLYLSIYLPIYL